MVDLPLFIINYGGRFIYDVRLISSVVHNEDVLRLHLYILKQDSTDEEEVIPRQPHLITKSTADDN